jgi:hypothetical protein
MEERETELYYSDSEKLGLDWHQIHRKDNGLSLKAGTYPCDFRDADGLLFLNSSLRIEARSSKTDMTYYASVRMNGKFEELSKDDLAKCKFKIKRQYVEIFQKRGEGRLEGVRVLCDKKTGKPIDIGPGICYVEDIYKTIFGINDQKTQCQYKVEVVKRKGSKYSDQVLYIKPPGFGYQRVLSTHMINCRFCFV